MHAFETRESLEMNRIDNMKHGHCRLPVIGCYAVYSLGTNQSANTRQYLGYTTTIYNVYGL